jgi:hypothetical protein
VGGLLLLPLLLLLLLLLRVCFMVWSLAAAGRFAVSK